MKNLVLLNRGQIQPHSQTYPDLTPLDSVFDPVSDTISVVLSSAESHFIEVQRLMKFGQAQVLASFPGPDAQLLSFSHFEDSALLVFVFSNGDLISAHYDPASPHSDTTNVEIVGLIDAGLLAACWSPDEETLVLLSNTSSVLLLSRAFEPISEKTLDSNDIKVSDAKHVSVGWGKEETQFKGKGFKALEREREAIKYAGLDLKEDSPLRDPTVAPLEKGSMSKFDPHTAKISWRGDAEYFAVSTAEEALIEATDELVTRRVIRVFSREGGLESVSEAVDGLEHNLAWRPAGSLIASTQRWVDADGDLTLQVVFYERNGLRHGQFHTRLDPLNENILDMEWSCHSDLLAFQLRDRVQIWTTKNYHWYLKLELHVSEGLPDNEVSFIKFHPEKPLQLMVGTTLGGVYMFNYAYNIVSGPTTTGNDMGMTVVIDGSEAKVTPLAIANVPPPIAYRDYEFDGSVVAAAVNGNNNKFAFILSSGHLRIASISEAEMRLANEPHVLSIPRDLFASEVDLVKQVCFIGEDLVLVLVDTPSSSSIVFFQASAPEPVNFVHLESRAVLLKSATDFRSAVVESIDGSISNVLSSGASAPVAKFPVLCHELELAFTGPEHTPVALGVSTNGKLYAGEAQLCTAVTSVKVTDTHLAFTTAHSQVCFVHLKDVNDAENFAFTQNNTHDETHDERSRQIERGSTLVSCIPSKYSVVLQAPRGNLETICPRIMVLNGVRKFIQELDYFRAFLACRTHRIDLDLLYDYDPKLFHGNVSTFIDQIGRADYLDLFLSCLHDEDVTETKYKDTLVQSELPDISKLSVDPQQLDHSHGSGTKRIIVNSTKEKTSSKVNKICKTMLEVLSRDQYKEKYLQTRITAYACQKPANLAGALRLISSLTDADEIENTITHLTFLLDVNKLYTHALELYDVKMALNIAQKSQKDPKEYLPFLQKLHVQTPLRRQFLIDDFLKHHSKALTWLHQLGQEAVPELDDYVVKHSLFKHALAIYKYDEARSKHILGLYADSLFDAKNFSEAGIAYEHLNNTQSALESYILAKRWREAMYLVQTIKDPALVSETARKLSDVLVDDHKYSQAAEIEHKFLGNVDTAVTLYCKSYEYARASLLALSSGRPELMEEIVDVQLGEGFGVVAELLADCSRQSNSQLRRLRELRQKKEEDPYAFYGLPNDDLDTPDNVSVAASETSTTPSFFTKYTGKTSGTAKTGASRKTAKNRKREERKRAKGRKGTIYEEEYLISSVGRLIERLHNTEADAVALVEALVRRHKVQQAYQIQQSWDALAKFLSDHIEEIHQMSDKDRERINEDGEVYLIDEIPVPHIRAFPKLEILDF